MFKNYARESRAAIMLPELVLGDRGYAVGWLQVMLHIRGYKVSGETANVFDRETEDMVRRFQQEMGIQATGIVDAVTWACLLLLE